MNHVEAFYCGFVAVPGATGHLGCLTQWDSQAAVSELVGLLMYGKVPVGSPGVDQQDV
ncbi:MAG: hypothetical protein O2954_04710 [bacterium]|nr:hypothetical protein [bacterium]